MKRILFRFLVLLAISSQVARSAETLRAFLPLRPTEWEGEGRGEVGRFHTFPIFRFVCDVEPSRAERGGARFD